MKAKTLEEVISDLKAQCDTKASAVADMLEDMRFNVEAKDFTLLDCADNVADMGEWGNYAAEQLRGKKTKKALNPALKAAADEAVLLNAPIKGEKINGLMDVMRGMYDHKKTGIEEMTPLKEALEAARKRPEYCKALKEYKADEKARKIAEIMRRLPVRACSIVCKDHPEWGTFGVAEDKGDYYEIIGNGGRRVLDKSEAAKFWKIQGNK